MAEKESEKVVVLGKSRNHPPAAVHEHQVIEPAHVTFLGTEGVLGEVAEVTADKRHEIRLGKDPGAGDLRSGAHDAGTDAGQPFVVWIGELERVGKDLVEMRDNERAKKQIPLGKQDVETRVDKNFAKRYVGIPQKRSDDGILPVGHVTVYRLFHRSALNSLKHRVSPSSGENAGTQSGQICVFQRAHHEPDVWLHSALWRSQQMHWMISRPELGFEHETERCRKCSWWFVNLSHSKMVTVLY
jgi:hypothetical protein